MKIVVIDAFSLIHRAYHAMPGFTTKTGESSGAIYGFCSMFLKMVNEKLRLDGYARDYSRNLGLSDAAIQELKRTIKNALAPMIRTDEEFDLDEVLKYFNKLFGKKQAE